MLTKLVIRNFKRFAETEIELGNRVVFIGPNNSGKTSAMQALTLWDLGVKRWNERRAGRSTPERRPGVTVNRRDLLAVPHPNAALLWRDLHVRDVRKVDGRQQTRNVRIDLTVEGVHQGKAWACGMEFDYANEESFYCRPLRLGESGDERMSVPPEAGGMRIVLLPPMAGLAATETRLDQGAVNVRVGEGRTADVLRNLCLQIIQQTPAEWEALKARIEALFAVTLEDPRYIVERGEIAMAYRERGATLDLSSSGRGLQQTLLTLAYMVANPGAVVLLDEPDAHLEILRQREIYRVISEIAAENGNQVIAASHSEVLLNEAAEKDLVVAFVGKPHRLGAQSQVRKALAEIGFDQYYQAEQTGWVLYLEGSTDPAILQAFARRLSKADAIRALDRPFVAYVGNSPPAAGRHFHGLREVVPGLKGIAIYDRLDRDVPDDPCLKHLVWRRREIENYLCSEATLEAYARASGTNAVPLPLFALSVAGHRADAMREAVAEISEALARLGRGSPWHADMKVSDEFLNPLFETYFKKLGLPNLMRKGSFYEMVDHVPADAIDPEIGDKLDEIVAVAQSATTE